MDNLHGPDNTVVVRYGYVIYDGRPDTYTACHRNNCCAAARQSGSAGFVIN